MRELFQKNRRAVNQYDRPAALAVLLIAAGWILFVLSLFLPATDALDLPGPYFDHPMVGWQTAITSARIIISYPIILVAAPRLFFLLPLTLMNVLMLIYPMKAILKPMRAWLMAIFFLPAAAFAATLPALADGKVFLGFYFWIASFVVAAMGCIMLSFVTMHFPRRYRYNQRVTSMGSGK